MYAPGLVSREHCGEVGARLELELMVAQAYKSQHSWGRGRRLEASQGLAWSP